MQKNNLTERRLGGLMFERGHSDSRRNRIFNSAARKLNLIDLSRPEIAGNRRDVRILEKRLKIRYQV
jgi:hypothetical protein